jgi:hypothetical protein
MIEGLLILILIVLFLILLCLLPRAFWKGLGWLIMVGFIFYLLSEHPGLISPTAWRWTEVMTGLLELGIVVFVVLALAAIILKIDSLIPRPRRATPRQNLTRVELRFDIPRRADSPPITNGERRNAPLAAKRIDPPSDGALAPPGIPPRRDAPPRLRNRA